VKEPGQANEPEREGEPAEAEDQRPGVLFSTPPPPPIPESLVSKPAQQSGKRPSGFSSGYSSGGSSLAIGLGMASDLIITTGTGLGLGWLIDQWLGSSPWGFLIGLGLGMGGAMMRIIQRSKAMTEAAKAGRRKSEQEAN